MHDTKLHEIHFFGSSSQPFALGDVVVLVEATGYQLTSTVEYRQDQPDDEPEIREPELELEQELMH
jgi:hypothetical protein